MEKVSFCSVRTYNVLVCAHCLMSWHYTPLEWVCLCLPYSLPSDICTCWWDLPWSFCRLKIPSFLSLSSYGKCSSTWPFAELSPVVPSLVLLWPRTPHSTPVVALVVRRGKGLSTLACSQDSSLWSPEYWWPSLLQGHSAGSLSTCCHSPPPKSILQICSQHVLIYWVFPAQMQDFTLAFAGLHEIPYGTSL